MGEIVTIHAKQPKQRRGLNAPHLGIAVLMVIIVCGLAAIAFYSITTVGTTTPIHIVRVHIFEDDVEYLQIPQGGRFEHDIMYFFQDSLFADILLADREFIGWFEDADLTRPFDTARAIMRNTDIYAGWAKR